MNDSLHPSIGALIQRVRKHHKLTLSVLSQKSGVSTATLSQIEADKVNPTIATLWKIAEGLEIDLQSLLAGLEHKRRMFHVGRREDITRLDTDENGVHIRVFSPLSMAEDLEIYTLTFQSGQKLVSEPHPAGTEEYLTVMQGTVRVQAGDQEAVLSEEEFIGYHADIEHTIENTGGNSAMVHMIVRFNRGMK
ncbi:MAG: XRE family transcriptional regulator [Spirochaetota bacterium]|nr:XRE family transcriptional regulator [Spirochaetota bacterium]